MVLQAELYPHGGYPQRGYVQHQDYDSKNGYGHKEDYCSESGYYESGSSMQMMRPNVTTPQPAKHHVAGYEGYAHQDSGYGTHQSYHDHDSYGYPSGMDKGDGWYGKTQGFSGHESHGYPKPLYGLHQSASSIGYESHHGSYSQTGPSGYESMNYDYYSEGRNRRPSYSCEPQHQANKNRVAKGAVWVSKGI